jgi:ankyrin repeat protein
MSIPPPPPPPQGDDPIITQFKPIADQWELNDDNIKRIDSEIGSTILHNYCQRINTTPLEVYRYLIEVKGCDINAQDKNQNTPFYNALLYFNPNDGGNITVLMYLLNQMGVNANIKGQFGFTFLDTACKHINSVPLDVFKLLIGTQGFDINARSTALHFAIDSFNPNWGGDITVLIYLLTQSGINVNIKSWNGYTLLHYACENINKLPIDVFKLLIETHGCDVNAQDNNNDTPLRHALLNFNPNNGGNITILTYLLTQKTVNIHIKNNSGSSLLHIACRLINHLSLDVFKLLIEAMGLDVNVQAENKDTPIHSALRLFNPHRGDVTVLAYLINQKDVDVNIRGKQGHSFLHLACINNLPHSGRSKTPNAENDTILCQIVEMIVERCVQQVLDETTTPKTKTKNSILVFNFYFILFYFIFYFLFFIFYFILKSPN